VDARPDQLSLHVHFDASVKPASLPFAKPFLKWAGGKSRLLDRILPKLPTGGRFIEPFVGSAAVAINAPHDSILASDQNADLINLYQHIQRDAEAVIAEAQTLFRPETNSEQAFYALREEFNGAPASLRRSAIFIYLNRHAFNGLCRYNAKGKFNVPFGRYKGPNLPERQIRSFAQRTIGADFRRSDFGELMREAGEGDAVYCDPPYVPLSASASFTSYATDGFGPAEQQRLADEALSAANRGATVLISNHETLKTVRLYHRASLEFFPVQRMISANGSDRWAANELLALFMPQ